MRDTFSKLDTELRIWSEWAETASREENGWESDAPNWNRVINRAEELLVESNLRSEELSAIETVFCLSEQDEVIADFLKLNYAKVPKQTILALSKSAKPQVRWQLYDSLVDPDEFSRSLLLEAFDDFDNYVRRRAFLRLLDEGKVPHDLVARAAVDPEPVIREEARRYGLTNTQKI